MNVDRRNTASTVKYVASCIIESRETAARASRLNCFACTVD